MSLRLVVSGTGRVLACRARVARTILERALGLLGTSHLGAGEALVFGRTRQVHTFGMRYAIDVCFCTRDWRVLHVVTMRPHRFSRWVRGGYYAVEMAAGEMATLKPGDQLSLEELNDR